MNSRFTIILAFTLVFFLGKVQGQNAEGGLTIIEIDSVTHAPKQAFPFDQEFYIKIWKKKTDKIDYVRIYRQRRWLRERKIFSNSSSINKKFHCRELKRAYATYWPNSPINGDYSDSLRHAMKGFIVVNPELGQSKLSIINKSKYALVKIFPLNATSRYAIDYSLGHAKGEVRKWILTKSDSLLKISSSFDTSSTYSAPDSSEILNSLKYFSVLSENYTNTKAFTKEVKVGHSKLKKDTARFDWINENAKTFVSEKDLIYYINNQIYDSAITYILRKDPLFFDRLDSAIAQCTIASLQADLLSLVSDYDSLMRMYFLNTSGWKATNKTNPIPSYKTQHIALRANDVGDIFNGLLPLRYESRLDQKSKSDYTARLTYLDSTLRDVESIVARLEVAGFASKNYSHLLETLYSNRKSVKNCVDSLNMLAKEIGNYSIQYRLPCHSTRYKKGSVFVNVNSQTQHTSTGGYSTSNTEAKFTIRPDIGFAVVNNAIYNRGFKGSYTAPLLFIGARINLRPLDPELPFSKIRCKSVWHHLSINVGATTNSISDGETRFNLMGDVNPVVGIGFRLNNYLNLTSGVLMFEKRNPDVLMTNKQLAVMPYFGVAIDFDVAKTFKDLFDALK